jgi:hypothetical protein
MAESPAPPNRSEAEEVLSDWERELPLEDWNELAQYLDRPRTAQVIGSSGVAYRLTLEARPTQGRTGVGSVATQVTWSSDGHHAKLSHLRARQAS